MDPLHPAATPALAFRTSEPISGVAASRDGNLFAVSTVETKIFDRRSPGLWCAVDHLRIFPLQARRALIEARREAEEEGEIPHLLHVDPEGTIISQAGRLIATWDERGTVVLWDIEADPIVSVTDDAAPADVDRDEAVSPDGRFRSLPKTRVRRAAAITTTCVKPGRSSGCWMRRAAARSPASRVRSSGSSMAISRAWRSMRRTASSSLEREAGKSGRSRPRRSWSAPVAWRTGS
jgi:hypothetical protein